MFIWQPRGANFWIVKPGWQYCVTFFLLIFHAFQVPVDLNSAIFITLNPAGKGYGGRQKLPDNLKQLFRPIVMSVPDNELIGWLLA